MKQTARNPEDLRGIANKIIALDCKHAWVIEWRKKKNSRTITQNSTFHMWAEDMSNATGHSKNEMENLFRDEFCPSKVHVTMGREVWTKQTSKLTTEEFSEMLTRIYQRYVGELGFYLRIREDL